MEHSEKCFLEGKLSQLMLTLKYAVSVLILRRAVINSYSYSYAYFCRRKGTTCMKDGKTKSYLEKRHPNSTDRGEIVEKVISTEKM